MLGQMHGHMGHMGHMASPMVPQPLPGQMSEEALREAVLLETLARLLREKMGATGTPGARAVSSTVPPWRRAQDAAEAPPVTEAPQKTEESAENGSPAEKVEAPLEKFIRIFGLDELAAKCLLKLQDDEAAFVIESEP